MGSALAPDLRQAAEIAEADYLRMWRLRRMSPAELRLALGRDPGEAARWVESAARYGLVEAQLRLGQMRLDGAGMDRDEAAALAWFRRAARKGSAKAMNMVGRCLENGWGAPVDLAAAADWYARSARRGCDWGAYNWANMLFDGRGVAQDQAEAVRWYRRAADQGHARAMNLLARCAEEGWGVQADPVQARDWYRRSAEAGYFRAQYNHAALLAAEGRLDEASGWLDAALNGAPPQDRVSLAAAWRRHPDPRIAAFAGTADGWRPHANTDQPSR